MEVKRCPGMVDLLPEQMEKFRLIEGVFRELCSLWGYREIRTPVIEPLYLFTASGTLAPHMLSKLYSFVDWNGWSGERVVLRPESTIPTVRLFLEGLSQKSFVRLFYIQNIFSFQAKRRERWQAGAEFIGGKSPQADAELIFLALEILSKLNIKAELRLGHLGLVKALLKEFGGVEEDLDKVLAGEISAFGKLTPGQENALRLLFDLKGKGAGFISNFYSLLPPSPRIEKAIKDFVSLLEFLNDYPYTLDMTLGRGFEYYTGVVFGFYLGERRLGGGGRYDNLIPLLGNKELPASGFALSIDELIEIIPQPQPKDVIGVYSPSFSESLKICQELHKLGYVASPQPGGGKVNIEKTAEGFKLSQGSLSIEASSLGELLLKWKSFR